jgi:hypothetical protein
VGLTWLKSKLGADGKTMIDRPLQHMTFSISRGKYFLSGGWELKDGTPTVTGGLWAAVAAQ